MYKKYIIIVSIGIIIFNLIYQPTYKKTSTNDIYVDDETIDHFNL